MPMVCKIVAVCNLVRFLRHLVQSCPSMFWILGAWPSVFLVRHHLAPRDSCNQDSAESSHWTYTGMNYTKISDYWIGLILMIYDAVWFYMTYFDAYVTFIKIFQWLEHSICRPSASLLKHRSDQKISEVHMLLVSFVHMDNFGQAWPSFQAHKDAFKDVWRFWYGAIKGPFLNTTHCSGLPISGSPKHDVSVASKGVILIYQ